jgi:AraC-like DNA-binding protein
MRYCTYRPVAPLDEFVDFFWMMAGGEMDRRERILPSGTSELVINLREDEVRIYDSIEPELYKRLSGTVISGTYSGVFICDATQHQSMLGVHFRPGGAFPFLGAPATELTDAHANLEDLWGSAARDLRPRLCETTTTRRRFQLVEEALLERLRRSQRCHYAIEVALRRFVLTGRGSSTRDVAQEVGLSQRRFIQLFAIHVGLTPKLLCRILRFQQARALAEEAERSSLAWPQQQPARAAIDWAEIAIACGYYDQSHLINDFQNLSGLSPAEYIRWLRPATRLKDNHLPLPQ